MHICEQTYHVTSAVVDRLFTLLPTTRLVQDTFVVASGGLSSFSSRCETGPEEPEVVRPLSCDAQPGRDHEDAPSNLRSVEETQLLAGKERSEYALGSRVTRVFHSSLRHMSWFFSIFRVLI